MNTSEFRVGLLVKFSSWNDVYEIRGWSKKGLLTVKNTRTGTVQRIRPIVNTMVCMDKA